MEGLAREKPGGRRKPPFRQEIADEEALIAQRRRDLSAEYGTRLRSRRSPALERLSVAQETAEASENGDLTQD